MSDCAKLSGSCLTFMLKKVLSRSGWAWGGCVYSVFLKRFRKLIFSTRLIINITGWDYCVNCLLHHDMEENDAMEWLQSSANDIKNDHFQMVVTKVRFLLIFLSSSYLNFALLGWWGDTPLHFDYDFNNLFLLPFINFISSRTCSFYFYNLLGMAGNLFLKS